MTREVLSHIVGIGIYPTLSLCLFVVVFVAMLWRVARMDRRQAEALGALPLVDGSADDSTNSNDRAARNLP